MTKAPPLSVRFPAEVRARLADAAANEVVTVNRLIVEAVELHLDRLGGEVAAVTERVIVKATAAPRREPKENPRVPRGVGSASRANGPGKPAVVALPGGRSFRGPDPK